MISCHIHDYIEIACLYKIRIKLVLKDNNEITGVGKTTRYNNEKEECMLLETDSSNMDIVLTDIKTMTALEQNPHFETVMF